MKYKKVHGFILSGKYFYSLEEASNKDGVQSIAQIEVFRTSDNTDMINGDNFYKLQDLAIEDYEKRGK